MEIEQLKIMIINGFTTKQIKESLNCSEKLIQKYRKELNIPSKRYSSAISLNWDDVQEYYDDGHTLFETAMKFNVHRDSLTAASKKGKWIRRSKSDTEKLSRKTHPRTCKESTRKKLSNAMLDRRANGYEWTFVHSKRGDDGKSYPETFFTNVIENEFENKNYVYNFPFHRFSLDFAWIMEKKCIEIDGDQHLYDQEQKRRDKEKDQLLEKEGWKILRIRWKDIFGDPKTYIKIAIEFIAG